MNNKSNKYLLARLECIVIESKGDIVTCEVRYLSQCNDPLDFEVWDIEVPNHKFVKEDVFYVVKGLTK